jgi:hypothetical protein
VQAAGKVQEIAMSIATLLLLVALILFILAACNVPSRVNLVATGLAFATASVLVPLVT